MRDKLWIAVLVLGFGCSKSEPAPASSRPANQAPTTAHEPKPTSAKLIRNGQLTMEAGSYDSVRPALDRVLAEAGGHIESSRVEYGRGRVAWASLELRIPHNRFDDTLRAIVHLGTVTSETTTVEDVSEAYADLSARLANARRLETRFQQLVDAKASTVKDLLAVETELARVRETIEVYESKMRLYDSQIAMSKLTLELRLRDSPIVTASLGSDARSTLGGSWRALATFARGALLFLVGALPWLPLAVGLWFAVRYWQRRRRQRAAA